MAQHPRRLRRSELRWSALKLPDLHPLVAVVLARIAESRRRMREEPEAGYSTETVVVTALLVVLALVVLGIIAVKVTEKANGITLG